MYLKPLRNQARYHDAREAMIEKPGMESPSNGILSPIPNLIKRISICFGAQESILSTFYVGLFHLKVFCAAFL